MAIDEEWLFDEYLPRRLGETRPGPGGPLKGLANENLHNLKDYSYFTEARAAEKCVDLGAVTTFKSEMRQVHLWLQFSLPLGLFLLGGCDLPKKARYLATNLLSLLAHNG